MSNSGKQYVAPILIIIVGVGWILNVQGVIPNIDWVWTCSLAAVGVLTLAIGGINKVTAVIGPFLIVSSICSILRQTDKLSIEMEVPILTIALGVFLLGVRILDLPSPEIPEEEDNE